MLKFGKSALYERLLREKDRQIDILAEQIDYLRIQLATARANEVAALPSASSIFKNAPHAPSAPNLEVKPYVSDEELDALAMLDAGEITKEQLPEVLEALGMVPELEFESVG